MQQTVTLNEQEVEQAIIEYASKHGVKFDGMTATVNIIAGRKDNGTYATIDLKPEDLSIKEQIKPLIDASILPKEEKEVEETSLDEEEVEDIEPEDDDELFG
jgi:hypothetical protein